MICIIRTKADRIQSYQSLIDHVRRTDEFIVTEEKSILISVIIDHFHTYFRVWDIFIGRLFSRDAISFHTRCFNKASARRSDDELPARWTVSFGFEYRLYGWPRTFHKRAQKYQSLWN